MGTYLNWVAQKRVEPRLLESDPVPGTAAPTKWREIGVDKAVHDFNNSYVLYAFLGCSWRNDSGVVTFPKVDECKDHPWTYWRVLEDPPPRAFCVSIPELLAFDYDAHFVHSESLREYFQRDLQLVQKLHDLGAERLCYYFD
jgi:hypothetical protein